MSIINIWRELLSERIILNNSSCRILCRNLSKDSKKSTNFELMIKNEKRNAKKYLIIEDKCQILSKLNVENVSRLLNTRIDGILKWSFNKHNCCLVEVNDENFFMRRNIRQTFGLRNKSFANNTRMISINELPRNFLINSGHNNKRKSSEHIQKLSSRKNELILLNVKELKCLYKTNEEFLSFLLRDKELNELAIKLRFFIILQLERFICNGLFRNFRILPFGSSIAGFGTPNSDLDLVLIPPQNMVLKSDSCTRREDRLELKANLSIIADLLQYSIPNFSHFSRILKARIPIIKFWFDLAPIDIDLSIELSQNSVHNGVIMSSFLSHCHQLHPCVRDLILLIKIWAKQHGILKPYNWSTSLVFPGFTSFQLTSLAIYFLQKQGIVPPMAVYMKEFQHKNEHLDKQINTVDLLRDFFDFVLNFKYNSEGISILNATTIAKRDSSPIYIENPFESDLNVCKNIIEHEFEKFMTFVKLSSSVMSSENFALADIFDANSSKNIVTESIGLKVEDLFNAL